jgi:hypothetical protein
MDNVKEAYSCEFQVTRSRQQLLNGVNACATTRWLGKNFLMRKMKCVDLSNRSYR